MNENTGLTFDNDQLGLKPFSEKLEKFLMVEHEFVDGSLVVSLNAPFGSGKTTFLSMWKAELDQRRQKDISLPTVIMLNAWESDFCGDPLLAVVTGLINAAESNKSQGQSGGNRLREAAKDVAWFGVGLANNLASKWTGIDPLSAAELAETKKQHRKAEKPDFVALYERRAESLLKLKNTLSEMFGGESPKAFVFVDELDRCRPDYAVSYLETIKHTFDVRGLVFILAIDYEQLGCSARALFGHDLVFAEYFRKFAQRSFSLPEPNETEMRKLAEHYATRFIEKENKRTSLLEMDFGVDKIVELISALRMTPRQIQEAFRIIGHVAANTQNKEKRGRMFWCLGVSVILMAVLKVADPAIYRLIGKNQQNHTEIGKFLIKLLGNKNGYWWFCVYISAAWDGDPNEHLEKLFRDLDFISKDDQFDAGRQLGQFVNGWGHGYSGYLGRNRFNQIYGFIETAAKY